MIPDQMPTFTGFGLESFMFREQCHEKGMYAYVSWRWINPLAEWIANRKCLEIMAGAGWLTYALKQKGINIIATDDFSWHSCNQWENVTEIEQLTANQAIWKYGKQIDIVIMAWPYVDEHAYQALRLLNYLNHNALMVYIGEKSGGCTADDNFFANFEEIEDPGFEAVASKYQRFVCIRDNMKLGKCSKIPVRAAEQ